MIGACGGAGKAAGSAATPGMEYPSAPRRVLRLLAGFWAGNTRLGPSPVDAGLRTEIPADVFHDRDSDIDLKLPRAAAMITRSDSTSAPAASVAGLMATIIVALVSAHGMVPASPRPGLYAMKQYLNRPRGAPCRLAKKNTCRLGRDRWKSSHRGRDRELEAGARSPLGRSLGRMDCRSIGLRNCCYCPIYEPPKRRGGIRTRSM